MVTFSYPIILFLIPIVLIIWYVFFRERFGVVLPNSIIAKNLKTPKKIWFLWIIRTIIVWTIILILTGTNLIQTKETNKKVSQDIMVVFDISLSMLAEDIKPSRIEVAKTVVKNFISSRISDRIGLIIFAGKPFVSIPFSTDYSGIKNIISWFSPYLIRQDLPGLSGTNIWDAILLANMEHSGWISSEKSIILLTDGRANIWIDPIIAWQESRESNIKVYTIGIGSLLGSDLFYTDKNGKKIFFYDEHGSKLRADLDEPMMRKIADTTYWQYFHADNRLTLEKIFSEIDKKLPNITEKNIETSSTDLTPILLILLILSLLVERRTINYILQRYRLR